VALEGLREMHRRGIRVVPGAATDSPGPRTAPTPGTWRTTLLFCQANLDDRQRRSVAEPALSIAPWLARGPERSWQPQGAAGRDQSVQLGELSFAVITGRHRWFLRASVAQGQGEQDGQGDECDPCGHGRRVRCDSPEQHVSAMPTPPGQTYKREGVLPLGATPPRLRSLCGGTSTLMCRRNAKAPAPSKNYRNRPDHNMLLSTAHRVHQKNNRSTSDRRAAETDQRRLAAFARAEIDRTITGLAQPVAATSRPP
jgi:hypothetical protein